MPNQSAQETQPTTLEPCAPGVRVAPHVQAQIRGDCGTVIDLRRDRYISLNPLAARIWPWLEAGNDRDTILSRLAESFPERRGRLAEDFDGFVELLLEQGMLVRARSEDRPSAPQGPLQQQPRRRQAFRKAKPPPSVTRCWLTLATMDLTLRLFGFPTVRKLLSRRVMPSRLPLSAEETTTTCRRVDRAAHAYFKRAWCLQRSAALVWLLRGRAVAADLVLGVRPLPFAAHAWSEIDGQVINDAPTVRDTYHEIDRCRPSDMGAV